MPKKAHTDEQIVSALLERSRRKKAQLRLCFLLGRIEIGGIPLNHSRTLSASTARKISTCSGSRNTQFQNGTTR
jgi:hypothetical protein